MKREKNSFILGLVFLLGFVSLSHAKSSKYAYWQIQRKGANNFNKNRTTEEWYKNAQAAGIKWVRLSFGKRKNFLLGNYTTYKKLVEKDIKELQQSVAYAKKYDIQIVLVPISLFGAKYRQLNGNKHDMRLFSDKKYWKMNALFWQDIARVFKDNPTVVAYNLFNEPYGEYGTALPEHTSIGDDTHNRKFAAKYKGTSRDVQALSQYLIKAIRKIDTKTPIMVESGWYAQPSAFVWWKAFKDPYILYQFHMYEPYDFTSGGNFFKKKNLVYPGKIPYGSSTIHWNKAVLEKYLNPFVKWAKQEKIKPNQIVVGEFGCMRRNKGCKTYLKDLIDIFNQKSYHWAFYSYREDEWDGYDYEVGTKGLGYKYWLDKKAGKNPKITRKMTDIWKVIADDLKR